MPAACAQRAHSMSAACALHSLSTEASETCPAMRVRSCAQHAHNMPAACAQHVGSVRAAELVDRIFRNLSCHARAQLARSVLILSTVRLAKVVLPWRARSLCAQLAHLSTVRLAKLVLPWHARSLRAACAQPARSMCAACRQHGSRFFQMSTEFFKSCQTPFLLKFPRTISSP